MRRQPIRPHQISQQQQQQYLSQLVWKMTESLSELEIGRGANGSVFRIKKDGKFYALKKVHLKDDEKEVMREVEALKKCQHPHIVAYKGYELKDDRHEIAMEYCDGGDLSKLIHEYIDRDEKISEEDIIRWISNIASALKYIHAKKIIHRDIKPKNIFIMKSSKYVKLGDFGICRILGPESVEVKTCAGTKGYMAPEVRTKYTEKADMWSFGCTIYELMCRQKAFPVKDTHGWPISTASSLDDDNRGRLLQSGYSKELQELVSSLMEKDPLKRLSAEQVLKHQLIKVPGEYSDVVLCEDAGFGRPFFRCWRPDPLYSLARSPRDYEQFDDLERILHFEDYVESYKAETLLTYPLNGSHHTHMKSSVPDLQIEGLWFGVSGNQNDWCGNLGFKVSLNKLLLYVADFEDIKIYFMETVQFRNRSSSRLLIASENDPLIPKDLPEYNPHKRGGPWYVRHDVNYHLKQARRYESVNDNIYGHVLEFYIKLSKFHCKELFKMSQKVFVDHSEANDHGYRKCCKYRSGGVWKFCPSPWTERTSKKELIKFHKQRKRDSDTEIEMLKENMQPKKMRMGSDAEDSD